MNCLLCLELLSIYISYWTIVQFRFQVTPIVQPHILASSNEGLGEIVGITQSTSNSRWHTLKPYVPD